MTDHTSRRVRFAYLSLLLALTVFAVAETALGAGARRAEGLSACGTQAQPCTLEAVAVVAAPVENEGLTACGTQARPCTLEPLAVVAAPAQNEGLTACGSAENPCVLAPLAVQAERKAMGHLAKTARVEPAPVAGES